MRIVIVDNFPHIRDSLKSLLSTLDEVEIMGEAQDVPGAINLAEELQPDIAIVDINIPGGSGFDVLKEFKKKAGVVIVLTSDSAPPFRQKAQKAGADFFFDKSTEFEEMIEVLKLAVADAFLVTYNSGDRSNLSRTKKNRVLSWATTLNNYNKGKIGPEHCSEEPSNGGSKAAAPESNTKETSTFLSENFSLAQNYPNPMHVCRSTRQPPSRLTCRRPRR